MLDTSPLILKKEEEKILKGIISGLEKRLESSSLIEEKALKGIFKAKELSEAEIKSKIIKLIKYGIEFIDKNKKTIVTIEKDFNTNKPHVDLHPGNIFEYSDIKIKEVKINLRHNIKTIAYDRIIDTLQDILIKEIVNVSKTLAENKVSLEKRLHQSQTQCPRLLIKIPNDRDGLANTVKLIDTLSEIYASIGGDRLIIKRAYYQ